MTKTLAVCILAGALAGCATPQGKKLSSNSALPAVASGPSTKAANLTWVNKGEMIGLKHNGTITVMLDSVKASGNEWRLSQVPDPSVLTLVSHDYIPSENASPQGTEKWVFRGVGAGDVQVNMWYGKVGPAPLDDELRFTFTASVEN